MTGRAHNGWQVARTGQAATLAQSPAGHDRGISAVDQGAERLNGAAIRTERPAPESRSPADQRPLPQTEILGVRIDAVDLTGTVAMIEGIIERGERQYLAVCAVHSIMEADDDPRFREVLAAAALRVPDGMPLVWLSRRAGHTQVGRVRGADLVEALCARSAATGHRHYFYGGGPGIAQLMAERLQERHPGLQVAGTGTPGQLAIGQEEGPEVVAAINDARPDIVWVGLGCPKQEWWTHIHRPVLNAPVIVPVGAAFDFLGGSVREAPKWMQQYGLEWLHRLMQNPIRHWRRYVIGNGAFIRRIATHRQPTSPEN